MPFIIPMTAAEARAMFRKPPAKRPKYGNRKTEIDGLIFDSKAEATRYCVLKIRERAGEITDLVLQPKFPIVVNGALICSYYADFSYTELGPGNELTRVTEDVKSKSTARNRAYVLKRKLMLAVHGIEIRETLMVRAMGEPGR